MKTRITAQEAAHPISMVLGIREGDAAIEACEKVLALMKFVARDGSRRDQELLSRGEAVMEAIRADRVQ